MDWLLLLLKKVSLRTWIEIIVGVALAIFLLIYINRYKHAAEDLVVAQNNEAAYQAQIESDGKNIIQFQTTIAQLYYYNDSISKKLTETKDKLGIKDKQLKEAQYMLSVIGGRKDTLRIHDTIFRDPDFVMDTTIGDEWVKTHLYMQYPSTVYTEPEVKSEKIVFISDSKETVQPPKKFFLCRWFQKKHTVVRVAVDEQNPWIKKEQNVYYKIIDD